MAWNGRCVCRSSGNRLPPARCAGRNRESSSSATWNGCAAIRLLCGPPADGLAEVPDLGLLLVTLAMSLGIVRETEGELRAVALPAEWEEGLWPVLEAIWQVLPHLDGWDAQSGWHGGTPETNPYPSAYLLALLLLARLPDSSWAEPCRRRSLGLAAPSVLGPGTGRCERSASFPHPVTPSPHHPVILAGFRLSAAHWCKPRRGPRENGWCGCRPAAAGCWGWGSAPAPRRFTPRP